MLQPPDAMSVTLDPGDEVRRRDGRIRRVGQGALQGTLIGHSKVREALDAPPLRGREAVPRQAKAKTMIDCIMVEMVCYFELHT